MQNKYKKIIKNSNGDRSYLSWSRGRLSDTSSTVENKKILKIT